MPLNEANTRAQLIEPKLQAAGWTGSQITHEHFYRRDHRYTAGRIYLIGDEARRREPRRVDYLLRYTDAFPIAVVEAKAESHTPDAGLAGQALRPRPGCALCLRDQWPRHRRVRLFHQVGPRADGLPPAR